MALSTENKPLFLDLDADNPETTEIESLCMNCHENGQTRLLLTKIPFYKEVVLMSFSCEFCGYQNNEIQSSGQVAEKGIKITLEIKNKNDLNRQVVKSDYTSVKIMEIDFEIPAKSQKGEVTTIEGVLTRSITGLEQDQVLRRIQHPEVAEQIDGFIERLTELKECKKPFTLHFEDISGNCHVENPHAPSKDSESTISHFVRSEDQNHELGFYTEDEINKEIAEKEPSSGVLHPIAEDEYPLEGFHGEVLQFATNCSNCGSPCETNMKMTDIPHFKEVVIMATVCDSCGIKTNEVKSGGGIEPQGVKLEINIKSKDDFSRDILKSDTCGLSIPELELEVGAWALGGRFTTVEGILGNIRDQMANPSFSYMFGGDSQRPEHRQRMENFLAKFDEIMEGNREVTLVLDDPAGNSYVQSMRDDDLPDDRLKIARYDRSFDQNEDLGLNDMKTENY